MKLMAAGIVVRVAVSILAVRLNSAALFGVSPTDPVTYTVVPVALAAEAWLANYYPARRIIRSTPYTVLR